MADVTLQFLVRSQFSNLPMIKKICIKLSYVIHIIFLYV